MKRNYEIMLIVCIIRSISAFKPNVTSKALLLTTDI